MSIFIGGVIVQNRMLTHSEQFRRAGIPQQIIDLVADGSAGSSNATNDRLTSLKQDIIRRAVTDSLSCVVLL